jgi:hypothetical protein
MNCVLLRFIPRSQTTRFNRGRGRLAVTGHVDSVYFVVLLAALVGLSAFAQQPTPVERVYKFPRVEVERALRDLQAYATAPLPALDGFVNADSSTFDLYDNPQYDFRVKVSEPAPEQTLVNVSARVTAWNPNATPSQSRYVLLPSNGRLERELLDHVAAYLEKGSLRRSSNSPSTPTAPVSRSPGSSLDLSTTSLPPSVALDSAAVKSVDPITTPRDFKNADPATLAAEIVKVRAERDAVQREEEKLQQQISQLETDRNSRTHLSDLAMVKTAQAPIFEQPNEFSKVLLRADPEDEFEVTEARYGWVHIRLQNLGQGWIKISELQLPNEPDNTGDSAAADFTEPSEEVAPFTGNWALLKDKPTLFVMAQPKHAIPKDSLGQSQIEFAKHAFLDGYRTAAHSQEKIVGVAVLFLGDKAGVAAATLTDIDRWQKGTLSDKLFLARCSLSPPDAFRDAAKH